MVVDTLKNAPIYYKLSSHFETALRYLEKTDFSNMEAGRYEVDGDNVFAFVQRYKTLPAKELKAEGHEQYADIQYVVDGRELIGFAYIKNAVPTGEAIPEADLAFYHSLDQYIQLEPQSFAIMWPHDIHTPKCIWGEQQDVLKICVKVKVG